MAGALSFYCFCSALARSRRIRALTRPLRRCTTSSPPSGIIKWSSIPTWASSLGDRRWNDRWSDNSLDAIYKRHDHDIATLNKLTKIDRAALSPSDQLNYDLFKKDYENDIEDFQYRWYLLPLNQLGGVHTVNQLAETLRFDTLKDYEDWLARLKALPVRIDQTIALMRLGMQGTNHSSRRSLCNEFQPKSIIKSSAIRKPVLSINLSPSSHLPSRSPIKPVSLRPRK